MKVIINRDVWTSEYEICKFYPLAEDDWPEEKARRTTGYAICWNPIRNTIVISGMGGISVPEIEQLANGLLLGCQEARAIAKEKGLQVG